MSSPFDTLTPRQCDTLALVNTWTGPVWRIHTSIYDTAGALVRADCESDAIEHICTTLDIGHDQQWFDEVLADYKADGFSDEDAWNRANEGFYWVNGAEPCDLSDWTIKPANKSDIDAVHHINHVVGLIDALDADSEDAPRLMAILAAELDRIRP